MKIFFAERTVVSLARAMGDSRPGLAQLAARADAKLAERLAQVPFDGADGQEQLGAKLRIAEPVTSEPGDLHFLRGELIARLGLTLADGLAGSQQLATAALGQRLSRHRGEAVVGSPELLARVPAAVLPAEPLAVQKMGAHQGGTHAGAAEALDRLTVEALGGLTVADQRP